MATSVKLDAELTERLKRLAGRRQRTAHALMREAIREFVEREEARESFKEEALASWTAFQETGRQLSGDELRGWLKSWGSDAEAEAPDCHD